MPQSDRNNGLFHCLRQAGDGEVHHGKQTGRHARTVERGYFREASHKPRQRAMALKLPDMGHVWIMCLDYSCFVKHTLLKHSACISGQAVHTPLRRLRKKRIQCGGMFSCVFDAQALIWRIAFCVAYFSMFRLLSGCCSLIRTRWMISLLQQLSRISQQ